jgi:hypothetical protein
MRTRTLGLVCSVALAACGDESFTPTEETVAGTYTAAVFELTTGGFTADLLALGATVTVTLSPDGTTSGHLFVPGAGENGGDLDEDLTGSWWLTGDTVTFTQAGNTLIPAVEFTAGEGTLTGEGSFEEDTVRLVLTRTG